MTVKISLNEINFSREVSQKDNWLILCTLWEVIPTLGTSHLEKVVWNWCLPLANIINDTTLALEDIQNSLTSLVRVVMHGRIALDFTLVPGLMP